ncbi:hypothetical protein ACFWNT_47650, partial [Streptomyces sp. NPDC058409]|uniref:hypothetical protein n=1 Tax=Streptomyces sp. NPDC058409 TaxID=3346484 RepID=UPI0036634DD1
LPDRLREHLPNNINYPDPSRIDVFKIRGQGPSAQLVLDAITGIGIPVHEYALGLQQLALPARDAAVA